MGWSRFDLAIQQSPRRSPEGDVSAFEKVWLDSPWKHGNKAAARHFWNAALDEVRARLPGNIEVGDLDHSINRGFNGAVNIARMALSALRAPSTSAPGEATP